MTKMPESALLEIVDLNIGTGTAGVGARLVQGLSVVIGRGEVVGLVGESGSGKSLSALSITGLLPPTLRIISGSISFEGTDISRLPENRLHMLRGKSISYVFQDPLTALNPTLTVGRQLMDVLSRHFGGTRADQRRQAVDALRAVDISYPEERLRAYPHELSGGMRQRVLIAMAVLPRPKLLIADEPTTALDVTVQAKIVDLLRGIRNSGISIIFISHNLDVVLELCTRVVVMYSGRVMEAGGAGEIAVLPRHPYTRALLDCVPNIEHRRTHLQVIAGQLPNDLGDYRGCPYASRCERAMERCRSQMPPLENATDSHAFACWNPVPRMQRAV